MVFTMPPLLSEFQCRVYWELPVWCDTPLSAVPPEYWYKISSLPRQKSLYPKWECINQDNVWAKKHWCQVSLPTPEAGNKGSNADCLLSRTFRTSNLYNTQNHFQNYFMTQLHTIRISVYRGTAHTTFPSGLELNSYPESTSSYRGRKPASRCLKRYICCFIPRFEEHKSVFQQFFLDILSHCQTGV